VNDDPPHDYSSQNDEGQDCSWPSVVGPAEAGPYVLTRLTRPTRLRS
jgi:hypothetical protein